MKHYARPLVSDDLRQLMDDYLALNELHIYILYAQVIIFMLTGLLQNAFDL